MAKCNVCASSFKDQFIAMGNTCPVCRSILEEKKPRKQPNEFAKVLKALDKKKMQYDNLFQVVNGQIGVFLIGVSISNGEYASNGYLRATEKVDQADGLYRIDYYISKGEFVEYNEHRSATLEPEFAEKFASWDGKFLENQMPVNTKDLVDLSKCASTDVTRPHLNGINFDGDKNTMAATNGHLIYVAPFGQKFDAEFTVPLFKIEKFVKAVSWVKGEKHRQMHVRYIGDGWDLTETNYLDFPNWQYVVIGEDVEHELVDLPSLEVIESAKVEAKLDRTSEKGKVRVKGTLVDTKYIELPVLFGFKKVRFYGGTEPLMCRENGYIFVTMPMRE